MGNQASQLGDEPSAAIAQKNLHHFDHSFKAQLHTVSGNILGDIFGECKFAKRPVLLTCKGPALNIIEEQGISSKVEGNIYYGQISGIAWDHANSEVKITFKPFEDQTPQNESSNGEASAAKDNFVILIMANSIELEGELKLRLAAMAAHTKGARIPTPMYVGMFAGATKPKPFQRKRPNLSNLPAGKLPALADMRSMAVDSHRGSYRPCPQGHSRRKEIALQHIYEGFNSFQLLNVRGETSLSNQFSSDSVLVIAEESLNFKPRGVASDAKIEFFYDDIVDWNAVDNDNYRMNDSGIEIITTSGAAVYFGVEFLRDVKHSLEYFWNRHKVNNGMSSSVKLGSTHGRPIVSVATLSGDLPPPPESIQPSGQSEVVDYDGMVVRPGAKLAPRKKAGISSKEVKAVPPENRLVKNHWHKVVLHQGWLLKQGGVGVGSIKSWIKRYFVLYKTSQGHFLVYYSDFTECPMYTVERHHRNYIDLAKCTFIRPDSKKHDNQDTPAFSFDIVTIEREWTLCAESQENAQRWLKLLTKAVDEDVAVLPDEELIFKVKPKVDPLGILPPTDYSTSLKVSAYGISVCTPIPGSKDGSEREHYFWVYTDFYKWSLLSQAGKLALLVNVFADSSFSRRNEYIFRNKEAQRLATAIEFFIEKFMSVMHIRLETSPGAFDGVQVTGTVINTEVKTESANNGGVGMHNLSPEEMIHADEAQELDLLGLEIGGGDDENFDGFGSPTSHTDSALTNTINQPPTASVSSASDPFVGSAAPSAPTSNTVDLFGTDDPFGSDPFGTTSNADTSVTKTKVAPPLSPQQISQHRSWFLAALASNGGAFYDDGTLQISVKVEVRGSQARVTLMYHNQSPAALEKITATVSDPSGLIRFELASLPTSIDGLGRVSQVMMAECLKPVFPGPNITISFIDTLQGSRSNTLDLPVIVTTFNEPLSLHPSDFMSRWQQLVAPGQEAQEILKPSYPIVPAQVIGALVNTLKFGRVDGLPDATEFVVYGAASLKTGALAPSGEKISVGCLAKIEMNVQANALRVTLRTVHAAASQSILQAAKSLLL